MELKAELDAIASVAGDIEGYANDWAGAQSLLAPSTGGLGVFGGSISSFASAMGQAHNAIHASLLGHAQNLRDTHVIYHAQEQHNQNRLTFAREDRP